MHGQIGGDETDVIPFARAAKGSAPNGADQLDKAGQTILQLLHKAAGYLFACLNLGSEDLTPTFAALRKKTVGTRWRRRRSFRISCAPPKIELRS